MNLIDGAIDRSGGFVPATASGVAMPLGRTDLSGQPVQLGLRPEMPRLVAPQEGLISATVDFIEELGASRVIHLDWVGQRLAVLQNDPTQLRPGDTAGVSIPDEAIQLFATETGQRLDRGS